ncbi:eukaryotic translation initiation factor 2 subunit gamma [Mucor velutinosus]|uniref:Eukaryotic translation initiation factor 2 subunit gamma n=1 Tax=Mucor velutinosus TaxID=708070 RepID=A0AAN7I2G5_9FUNG|nr:eukaryotic translation initiation factor 2 subunit gamma [Mucor velutinosus]
MDAFETCFPKKRSDIYLPEDDVDFDEPNVNRLCCCFNFRGNNRQGLIQLPTNNRNQRTIDDYLDPRSPVSIEALLQEQEEELDHYFGQTVDEDAYHGPPKRFGPLDLNFETTNSSFFEEEDAQFLSEHRISAILVDRPKLSSAHLFKEDTPVMEQELVDVGVPTKSTSTGSISSRRFAFRKEEPSEEEEVFGDIKAREIEANTTTQIPSPLSPQELTSITNKLNPYTTSASPLSTSSPTSTATSASLPSITYTSVQPMEQQLVNGKANGSSQLVSPVNTAGLSGSNYKIPTSSQNGPQQKHANEFPATTLTRVPYQPLPPLQISPPSFSPSASASSASHHPHTVIKPQASISSLSSSHNPGRRPSLVTTAQSILGDKLDDFTEKLAFIKKNIIMSMDNDDDEDDDGDTYNHYYNADKRISQEMHRKRAASVGKSDQMSRTSRLSNNSSTSLLTPPPRSSSITQNHSSTEEEEDEIFDKVVAISKNVRTFGEGVMGNGLRMFNNLSTRIKNAQQQ